MNEEPVEGLQPEELNQRVTSRLELLNEMGFLELYAMFMGKAQILEMGLKLLLRDKYGYKEDNLEKLTLGQARRKLEEFGARQDFIDLLESVVDNRNDLAHNFLQIDAAGKSLIGTRFQRLSEKQLRHALYSVEEAIQVYDYLSENGLW